MNIGFIGVGNLASSIIKGIKACNDFDECGLYLYDRYPEKAIALSDKRTRLCVSEVDVVKNSEYIFIAIKPADFDAALFSLRNSSVILNKVFISTAAAISTKYISDNLGGALVVRTMPNLPIAYGVGATAVCAGSGISDAQLTTVVSIFSACGVCRVLDESEMNKVIAINGSSPAYVFLLAEHMESWAVDNGFSREDARLLIAQAIKGSAEMLLKSAKPAAALTEMVCSPGGTTIEAVNAFTSAGFEIAVTKAMDACTEKADKMSR